MRNIGLTMLFMGIKTVKALKDNESLSKHFFQSLKKCKVPWFKYAADFIS